MACYMIIVLVYAIILVHFMAEHDRKPTPKHVASMIGLGFGMYFCQRGNLSFHAHYGYPLSAVESNIGLVCVVAFCQQAVLLYRALRSKKEIDGEQPTLLQQEGP